MHLVDWKSGTGQVIGSLKMNAGVKSIWWAKGGNGEGRELMSLSDNAEVYVWDIAERKCTRWWQNDGEFGSILGILFVCCPSIDIAYFAFSPPLTCYFHYHVLKHPYIT